MPTDAFPRRAWLAAAVAAVTILCAAIVLRKTFAEVGDALPVWSLVLAAVWTAGGLVLLFLTRTPGVPPPRRWSALPVLATALVSLGTAALCFVGGAVLRRLPWTSEWIGGALLAADSGPLLTVVVVALVAGAAEELFFRLGFANLFSGVWRWVVPNVLYALVTIATGNLALALVAPVLGLAATTARELTGRWWAPLVVHAVWTITMVLVFPLVVR
ncbi:CPBP family glutamic-type intramembrane protease [Microbacterium gorillae]|uniref:CPBP family glutamic-type intramembrane protease n=1 Tax=Microbacterium gorillae TaxID=1231063 RepID=UPI0006944821|nr:CPBP family glutamic-type intramembrane protease [Microbacterium gorillae]